MHEGPKTKAMTQRRPTIFLYTDQAEVTDEVKAAMVEAGYLPL